MSSRLSDVSDFIIQVPCDAHLTAMKGMPAGLADDQVLRLSKIKKTLLGLQEKNPGLQISDSAEIHDSDDINVNSWRKLFAFIQAGEKSAALALFEQFPVNDILYRALLVSHDASYLQQLISLCCKALENPQSLAAGDVIITNQSIEILISDLIATVQTRHKMTLNCGLPSHHAKYHQAAGFCLINKLAVLIAFDQLSLKKPPYPLIIGTDINQDDGLHEILSQHFDRRLAYTHLDVLDERVYPWPDSSSLERQTRYNRYLALSLAQNPRQGSDIHPIITHLLAEIDTHLQKASQETRQIALYIPLGWDSHQGELAPCGREINRRRALTKQESRTQRFNDADMNFFYQELKKRIEDHATSIHSVTINLEGGYTDTVIKAQLKDLVLNLSAPCPKPKSPSFFQTNQEDTPDDMEMSHNELK